MASLISEWYLNENRRLHENEGYGAFGNRWVTGVIYEAQRVGAQDILDYGCGKGALRRALTSYYMDAFEYDPAVPGKDKMPSPADLVVCIDVLEHIEPPLLHNVLIHLHSLTKLALLVVISTRPAGKLLSDGRNAHLIIESEAWWRNTMQRYFKVKAVYHSYEQEWIAFMRPKGLLVDRIAINSGTP